jgi:hypothetical protein
MKINVLLLILAAYALLGAPEALAAEQYIYKWKDSQGMVHYTERPPEPGITFEKVRRSTEKGEKSTPTAATQASTKSANTPKDDSYNSWREENCKIANQNLDVLENAARIAQDDGQGGKRLMTDEEKAEKIKKMSEQRDKYCEAETADNN